MKIRLLLLVMSILAISCSKDQNYRVQKITTFPINKELISEVVEIDSMPSCPKYLVPVGKYMVLLNFDNCDNDFFHVYDKKSFRFIGSFGTSGRGPNELMAPYPSKQVVDNDTLSGFWILNQKNNRYELVNIEKSLKRKKCIVENNYYWIPLSEGRGMGAYKVDDENIIVYSIAGEKGRFYSYNLKNKSTKWVGFFPKISTTASLSKKDMSLFYDSECALSMDGKFFISVLDMAKRIDIFNNKLEHQISVVYNDSPKDVKYPFKDADWHNIYAHFPRIYADNKLIYVFNDKRSLSGRRTGDNPEVHIFSLEGKAIARYQLDNKRYEDFTIDEESSSIICLSNTDEGYPQITRYIIPE